MPVLQDMVVRLAMDTRGFQQGARGARTENDRLAANLRSKLMTATERQALAQRKINELYNQGKLSVGHYRRALTQLNVEQQSGGQQALKMQSNLTQLAFAAEDASVSFGTGGLAGSIRGASNNLVLMAATSFGAKGALAAVAIVAVVQLVPALLKAAGVIGDNTEALKEYNKHLDQTKRLSDRLKSIEMSELDKKRTRRELAGVDSSERARGMAQAAEDRREDLIAEDKSLIREQQMLEGKLIRGAEGKARGQARKRLREIEGEREALKFAIQNQIAIRKEATNKAKELEKEEAKAREQSERRQVASWERQYDENKRMADKAAQEEAQRKLDKAQREEERARSRRVKDREKAENMLRDMNDEIDPNEKRAAKRDVIEKLQDRYREIERLSISAEKKDALRSRARLAAATQMAELDKGPEQKPIEAMHKGSREALMSILNANMKSKEDPKESTQQKIKGHLQKIENHIKSNPNAFTLGAFENP